MCEIQAEIAAQDIDASDLWIDLQTDVEGEPVADGVPARWLTLGVSTASFALITTYSDFDELDIQLRIALWCFVIATPAGILSYLTFKLALGGWYERVQDNATALGNLSAAVGTASYLGHFDWIAAGLFLLGSLGAFALTSSLLFGGHQRKAAQIAELDVAIGSRRSEIIESMLWPHRDFGIVDEDYVIEYVANRHVRLDGLDFDLLNDRDGAISAFRLHHQHCRRVRRFLVTMGWARLPRAKTSDDLDRLVQKHRPR